MAPGKIRLGQEPLISFSLSLSCPPAHLLTRLLITKPLLTCKRLIKHSLTYLPFWSHRKINTRKVRIQYSILITIGKLGWRVQFDSVCGYGVLSLCLRWNFPTQRLVEHLGFADIFPVFAMEDCGPRSQKDSSPSECKPAPRAGKMSSPHSSSNTCRQVPPEGCREERKATV